MSNGTTNYGYGEVPTLPIPARERPPVKSDGALEHILPGGGKKVKMPSGEIVVAGGECLRSALANGGIIIGEEPMKKSRGKTVEEQQAEACRAEVAGLQEIVDRGIGDPLMVGR